MLSRSIPKKSYPKSTQTWPVLWRKSLELHSRTFFFFILFTIVQKLNRNVSQDCLINDKFQIGIDDTHLRGGIHEESGGNEHQQQQTAPRQGRVPHDEDLFVPVLLLSWPLALLYLLCALGSFEGNLSSTHDERSGNARPVPLSKATLKSSDLDEPTRRGGGPPATGSLDVRNLPRVAGHTGTVQQRTGVR